MKILVQLLKKRELLTALSLAGGGVVAILGVMFLIFPSYDRWQELAKKNKVEKERLERIETNIATLSRYDGDEVKSYQELISEVNPQTDDAVRVVAIIDEVARNSGLGITSVQIKPSTAGTAKTVEPSIPTQPAAVSKSAAPTTSQKPATTAKTSYALIATFVGSYQSAQTLMAQLDNVKRAIEVTKISFSKAAGVARPTINMDFSLSLAQKAAAASPEQKVELSQSEKDLLEDLLAKLTIDPAPAQGPVGKAEPLQ